MILHYWNIKNKYLLDTFLKILIIIHTRARVLYISLHKWVNLVIIWFRIAISAMIAVSDLPSKTTSTHHPNPMVTKRCQLSRLTFPMVVLYSGSSDTWIFSSLWVRGHAPFGTSSSSALLGSASTMWLILRVPSSHGCTSQWSRP